MVITIAKVGFDEADGIATLGFAEDELGEAGALLIQRASFDAHDVAFGMDTYGLIRDFGALHTAVSSSGISRLSRGFSGYV